MKKEVVLLVMGLVLVVLGALLKVQQIQYGQYIMIAGLALEAFTLGSLVLKSLKK